MVCLFGDMTNASVLSQDALYYFIYLVLKTLLVCTFWIKATFREKKMAKQIFKEPRVISFWTAKCPNEYKWKQLDNF